MHSGTKLFQNLMKIQWCVASIYLLANAFPEPFGDQLRPKMQHANVSAPKRACVPRNVPAAKPASKCFCLPRNCKVQRKDMDLILALQLATNKGHHVFITSIISQSDSRFASQPHRRKTYRHLVDFSKRASMQPSPDAVPEPRDSLTQIVAQNA